MAPNIFSRVFWDNVDKLFWIRFHTFAGLNTWGLNTWYLPVIEIRVTSARDYRAGRPTHDVLSKARRRCLFHLKNAQQCEGLTIFPFRCIHIRTREIQRGDRSLSLSAFQDDELLANRWCRWPRSRSPVGFLCASRDSTTLIVCRRVRIILR